MSDSPRCSRSPMVRWSVDRRGALVIPSLSDPDVIASRFYWPGADRDDVRQEAAFAAIVAERSHEPARGNLRSFVRLVVTRHLTEQVRRERYRRPQFSELAETMGTPDNVVDLVAARERLRTVLAADLTPVERTALGRAARGGARPGEGGADP